MEAASTFVVKRYRARAGARINNADAAVIGSYVDDRHGGQITPHEFVQEARPRTSPLHPYITWDDKAAATQYRLNEAREVLASVIVVYGDGPAQSERRAFYNVVVSDGSEAERAYVTEEVVWGEPRLEGAGDPGREARTVVVVSAFRGFRGTATTRGACARVVGVAA